MDNLIGTSSEPSQAAWEGRYTPSEWETQKSTIRRLYVDEEKTVKDVQTFLGRTDFVVTQKQLKDRIKKWGFDIKNIKTDDMKAIARLRAKRKTEGKESTFRVNKQPVNERKVDRFLKRHNISENDLLSIRSPENAASPVFSIYTPPALTPEAGTETPRDMASPLAMQPPSPSIPLQLLYDDQSERSSVLHTESLSSFSWVQRSLTPFSGQSPPQRYAVLESNPKSRHVGSTDQINAGHWTEDVGHSNIVNLPFGNTRVDIDQSISSRELVFEPSTAYHGNDSQVPSSKSQVVTRLDTFVGRGGISNNHLENMGLDASNYRKDTEEVASSSDLGSIHTQGYLQGEEAGLRQKLKVIESTLGREHPDTLSIILDLGGMAEEQGRYRSAELLFRRVAEARQRVLGNDNLLTADAFFLLGRVFYQQGRYATSERLLRQVLGVYVELLEVEHPVTLSLKEWLGESLWCQGRIDEAAELYREVLRAYQRIHGIEHSETLGAMTRLANLLDADNITVENHIELLHNLLESQSRILGEDHHDTIETRIGLATALERDGQYHASESLVRREVERRVRLLGLEHPDTLRTKAHLADALTKQGRYTEATFILEEVLVISIRVLGIEHPEALSYQINLANALSDQGLFQEAERHLANVLTIRKRLIGDDHPKTTEVRADLARLKKTQGLHEQARTLHKEVLLGRSKLLKDIDLSLVPQPY